MTSVSISLPLKFAERKHPTVEETCLAQYHGKERLTAIESEGIFSRKEDLVQGKLVRILAMLTGDTWYFCYSRQ